MLQRRRRRVLARPPTVADPLPPDPDLRGGRPELSELFDQSADVGLLGVGHPVCEPLRNDCVPQFVFWSRFFGAGGSLFLSLFLSLSIMPESLRRFRRSLSGTCWTKFRRFWTKFRRFLRRKCRNLSGAECRSSSGAHSVGTSPALFACELGVGVDVRPAGSRSINDKLAGRLKFPHGTVDRLVGERRRLAEPTHPGPAGAVASHVIHDHAEDNLGSETQVLPRQHVNRHFHKSLCHACGLLSAQKRPRPKARQQRGGAFSRK